MLKYQKGKIILVIFLVSQSINFKELIFNLNFLCVEIKILSNSFYSSAQIKTLDFSLFLIVILQNSQIYSCTSLFLKKRNEGIVTWFSPDFPKP